MKYLIALMLLITSATSFAAPLEEYYRAYSPAHLRSHPTQQVTKVILTIVGTSSDFKEAHLGITLRGSSKTYFVSSTCVRKAKDLLCTDYGGETTTFKVTKKNGKAVVRIVADTTFYLSETEREVKLSAGTEDSVFSLNIVKL